MSSASNENSRHPEAQGHAPTPSATDRTSSEPKHLSGAERDAALELNHHRLTRERTVTVSSLIEWLEAHDWEGFPKSVEVIAGVVVRHEDEPPMSREDTGFVAMDIHDGTGYLSASWDHGAKFSQVCDSSGEQINVRFLEFPMERTRHSIEDSEGYLWEQVRTTIAPAAQVGDLVCVRVSVGGSTEWEVGETNNPPYLVPFGDPLSLVTLNPIGAGEDSDWDQCFSDPAPAEEWSIPALLLGSPSDAGEPVSPSIMEGDDGVCLVREGATYLVSGGPDAGKTWFQLLAVFDLMERKPWGRVVWFDADGLGRANIVQRLRALGCPIQWIEGPGTRFVIVPVGQQSHDEWVTRVADLAREVMPIAVVWDGLNAALAATGCGGDEAGVVRFRHHFLDPFRHARPACIGFSGDHISKAANLRTDRYSYGAQGKLAQHDTHFRLIPPKGKRLTLTTPGEMYIWNARDRTGTTGWDGRTLTITPGTDSTPLTWRHTGACGLDPEERLDLDLQTVLTVLRENEPMNTSEVRRVVRLKNERTSVVLAEGVKRGLVMRKQEGSANIYSLAAPDDDDTGVES